MLCMPTWSAESTLSEKSPSARTCRPAGGRAKEAVAADHEVEAGSGPKVGLLQCAMLSQLRSSADAALQRQRRAFGVKSATMVPSGSRHRSSCAAPNRKSDRLDWSRSVTFQML